ncbi:MAG: D-alanine--D-alanine ligase [Phycisphaerales bacterium]|nr:MAG: D-alanine--D-alanine ligase [Phycisphaerales bacterium]
MFSVLVLGGGPDRERPVSLRSAAGVADALREAGYEVNAQTVDKPSLDELKAMEGDVVFPVLHGPWGEGGPLQLLLEELGRPFVGSGADASVIAMDKLATAKLASAAPSVRISQKAMVDPSRDEPPGDLPLVVKPVRDGSSFGVYICTDEESWKSAIEKVRRDAAEDPSRRYFAEPYVKGRELTVSVLDGRALPVIEIVPASGVYDYQAKYERGDTKYLVDPELPGDLSRTVQNHALLTADAIGVRDLCRVDFIMDERSAPWMLEVNTMPGFTPSSLFPKAAKAAGLSMEKLCSKLVELAAARGA